MPARWAAAFLRKKTMAIVLGRTIHLWNATAEEFYQNEKWKRHELAHILQYKRFGFLPFVFKYTWESMQRGYEKNKYEVEAREKENETGTLEMFNFICQKK